jgi:hypothetical protein
MPQQVANTVVASDTFQTWLTNTNKSNDFISKIANTTAVAAVYAVNVHVTSTANTLKLSVHGNSVFSNLVTMASANSVRIKSGGVNGVFSNGNFIKVRNTDTGEMEFGNAASSFSDLTGVLANNDFAAVMVPTSGAWTLNANTTIIGSNTNITSKHILIKANVAFTQANTDFKGGKVLFTANVTYSGTNVIFNNGVTFYDAITQVAGVTATFNGTLAANVVTAAGTMTGESTFVAKAGAPINTIGLGSNTYTLVLTDNGKYLRGANTGGMTVTIPTNASIAYPTGAEIILIKTGGNNEINFSNVGVTINSEGGKRTIQHQYKAATLKKVGTNEWDLIGNLSP